MSVPARGRIKDAACSAGIPCKSIRKTIHSRHLLPRPSTAVLHPSFPRGFKINKIKKDKKDKKDNER